MSRTKLYLGIIFVLSMIMAVTAGFLYQEHYNPSTVCSKDGGGCLVVNTSVYSEIFNTPVALFGVIWAAFLYIFARMTYISKSNSTLLFAWSLVGVAAVAYFIYAEFQLGAICKYCTIYHIMVLISAGISYKLFKKYGSWSKLKTKNALLWLTSAKVISIGALIFYNI